MSNLGEMQMTLNEYQEKASRTLKASSTHAEVMNAGAYNLASEGGEAINIIKKVLLHGHDMDAVNTSDKKGRTYRECLKDEVGDALWALGAIAKGAGFTLEDAGRYNIAKLQQRYPNGFTSADSIARVDTEAGEVTP